MLLRGESSHLQILLNILKKNLQIHLTALNVSFNIEIAQTAHAIICNQLRFCGKDSGGIYVSSARWVQTGLTNSRFARLLAINETREGKKW
jgi:hypothetical protein